LFDFPAAKETLLKSDFWTMSEKEDTMESSIEIVEKEIGMVVELEENLPVWKMPSAMGNDYNGSLAT
jgi:hypothetical protein